MHFCVGSGACGRLILTKPFSGCQREDDDHFPYSDNSRSLRSLRSSGAPPILSFNTLVSGVCRMRGKTPSERPAFTAYAVTLGLGGAALALASLRGIDSQLQPHAAAVLCFAVFIGVAWRFPFSILPRTRMSMDFVFIIAALAVLPHPLPYLVGLGAVLLGWLLRRGETAGSPPGVELPFLNAGVLFVTLAVGHLLAARLRSFWDFSRLGWRNAVGVVVMFVAINLLNMALLSVAMQSRGASALEFIRHHLLVISPLEIFTIPLVLSLVSL